MNGEPRLFEVDTVIVCAGQTPLRTLYDELADWFHLLTAPEDYAEEAAFILWQLGIAE